MIELKYEQVLDFRGGGLMNLYDEIARLAYELYEKKGRRHGCDFEDWLEAEIIVISGYQSSEGGIQDTSASVKPKRQRKTTAVAVKKKSTRKSPDQEKPKPKRSTRKKKVE